MEVSEQQQITITFTVGQINQLLATLAELPFNKSADAIAFIKSKGDEQLAAMKKDEAA